MRISIIFICIFLSSGNFYCQLIRPNFIYENVIKEVYDHYDNTGIIMIHGPQYSMQDQGLRESENLLNLQRFFSRAYIPTTIMSMSTFRKQAVRQWIVMRHTWLIFLRKDTSIEKFLEDIYYPFDSTMMVSQPDGNLSSPGEIISEVYRINKGNKLRNNLLGTWNQEMGIVVSPLSFYERRNNLQGHTLRVTSMHLPPLSPIIRDRNGTMIGLGGYYGGLMDLLQERMNFTILYREAPDLLTSDENGSPIGAVIDLLRNKTDIVATAVEMETTFLNVMTFTIPVSSFNNRIYIKRPGPPTSKWSGYFIPFEPNVWIAIVVMIVITTFTMFLLNSAISLFASHWKDNGDIPTSVPDIFFAVLGVFCSQGMAASILDPIRITHFVIHLTAVIILTAYSADMISVLTVPTYVLPFKTLEGLLQDGTYRFGITRSSILYADFKNASNEIDRAIFNKFLLKPENLPDTPINGLKRVCNEDKYAFMSLDHIVSLYQSQFGCTVVPLDEIRQRPGALLLRKSSPYLGIINSHLLKLRDSGIMQRLLNVHMPMTGDNVDKGLDPVGMKNILPLLVLFVAGVFMSLIILSIEKFLKRNEKIVKKEKKILKKFLKEIKLPSTQNNNVQPFYN